MGGGGATILRGVPWTKTGRDVQLGCRWLPSWCFFSPQAGLGLNGDSEARLTMSEATPGPSPAQPCTCGSETGTQFSRSLFSNRGGMRLPGQAQSDCSGSSQSQVEQKAALLTCEGGPVFTAIVRQWPHARLTLMRLIFSPALQVGPRHPVINSLSSIFVQK